MGGTGVWTAPGCESFLPTLPPPQVLGSGDHLHQLLGGFFTAPAPDSTSPSVSPLFVTPDLSCPVLHSQPGNGQLPLGHTALPTFHLRDAGSSSEVGHKTGGLGA